ncbi:hypothetical protein AB0436_26845 [Streptomyces sp. NPDC051322]|uniref:hypothetical protein n=1 Tax=Streptomyces sp. NPDC051322 TaxID=3154645 RepID=UPI00344F9015
MRAVHDHGGDVDLRRLGGEVQGDQQVSHGGGGAGGGTGAAVGHVPHIGRGERVARPLESEERLGAVGEDSAMRAPRPLPCRPSIRSGKGGAGSAGMALRVPAPAVPHPGAVRPETDRRRTLAGDKAHMRFAAYYRA